MQKYWKRYVWNVLPVRSALPFRCCFRFELRTFTESLESLPERRTVAHSNDYKRRKDEASKKKRWERSSRAREGVPLKIFLTLPRGECVHQLIAKCQLGTSKGAKMSMVISILFNDIPVILVVLSTLEKNMCLQTFSVHYWRVQWIFQRFHFFFSEYFIKETLNLVVFSLPLYLLQWMQ